MHREEGQPRRRCPTQQSYEYSELLWRHKRAEMALISSIRTLSKSALSEDHYRF